MANLVLRPGCVTAKQLESLLQAGRRLGKVGDFAIEPIISRREFLNREFKEPGDLEWQGQTRMVFPGPDRVTRLARDAEFVGEIALRRPPAALLFGQVGPPCTRVTAEL